MVSSLVTPDIQNNTKRTAYARVLQNNQEAKQ